MTNRLILSEPVLHTILVTLPGRSQHDIRGRVFRALDGADGYVTMTEALEIAKVLDRAQQGGHQVIARQALLTAYEQYVTTLADVEWPDSHCVGLRRWNAAVDGPEPEFRRVADATERVEHSESGTSALTSAGLPKRRPREVRSARTI